MKRQRPPRVAFQAMHDLSPDRLAAVLAGAPEEAVPWISAAARHGLVEAQLLLGQILLDGRGMRSDAVSAAHWFGAAAEAGCVEAMNMLGRCHEQGWGVARDDAMAAHWYSLAAEHGLDWALYNLANLTLRGRGVAKDRRQALFLYLRAAHLGHAKSMNMIGRFFEEGWEVERDGRSALEWYRRAAKGGDFRGQYNLGGRLAQAGKITEAAVWLGAAVRAGTPDFLETVADDLLRSEHVAIRAVGDLAMARLGRGMRAMPPPQPSPATRERECSHAAT